MLRWSELLLLARRHLLRTWRLVAAVLPELWTRFELSLLLLNVGCHVVQVGNLQGQGSGSEVEGTMSNPRPRSHPLASSFRRRRDLEGVLQPVGDEVLLLHLCWRQYVSVEENFDGRL